MSDENFDKPKFNQRFSLREKEFLLRNYNSFGAQKCCAILQRPFSSLTGQAEALGLKSGKIQRRVFFDDNFFEKKTLENCYWAGFIAADGSLNEKRQFVRLFLSIKDRAHVVEFAKALKFTGTLQEIPSTKSCGIALYGNGKLYRDLVENFNITEKKSLTLNPPQNLSISEKMAFIVGYIDGDGCIRIDKKNRLCCYIVGTNPMLQWIINELSIFYPKLLNKKITKFKHSNAYTFGLSCNPAKMVLSQLKNIQVPKLSRKWDKV